VKAPLGRLEPVDLRKYWEREDTEFTPWLAQVENLALLGSTLGLELVVEDTEVGVGAYRADILAKDGISGAFVLIENQIEKTDHSHLGQILTYAAGLDAVTIIWVASRFTEEHRAALDWLNRVTEENISFFGVEVELWRIGESAPAPKFNVVSKPNDWTKSIAEAAHHGDQSPAQERNREFWSGLMTRIETTKSALAVRKAAKDNWVTWGIGRSGYHLWARLAAPAAVGLNVSGEGAAERYALLREQKDAIEKELGEPLEWQTEPKKEWLVKLNVDANPDDRAAWPRLQEWMQTRVERLDKVLRARVKALPEYEGPVES
jgi:hypothetical protein